MVQPPVRRRPTVSQKLCLSSHVAPWPRQLAMMALRDSPWEDRVPQLNPVLPSGSVPWTIVKHVPPNVSLMAQFGPPRMHWRNAFSCASEIVLWLKENPYHDR